MARRRSAILLLSALVALLGVPASAFAQDTNPPTNTTPATPVGWLTAPYVVALSGTDVEPGPVNVQWRLDGGAPTTVASGDQITVSSSGTFSFETQAVDGASNVSGWRAETLRIDRILPTDGTDAGTTAWRPTPASVQILAADVTSGLARVEWELDSGGVQSGPNNSTVAIGGDGVHTLRTRAVDVAGNVSAWRDHTVRVDTVTPTDTTAPPAGWQTAPLGVNVTGSDAHSGIAQVTWRVNGGAPTTVAPPATVTVSTEGVNTVETRVRDAAGHETGYKTSTVRIDTTAPTNQTPAADGVWTTADYNVLVTAADATSGLAEVQYRINAGPWIAGPSGLQATVAGTGDHTLETRAVDVAGNTSVARLDHVRIDRVAPTNTTAAAPGGAVGNPYQVVVTGTDAHAAVDRVEWEVDGGGVQSGASGSQATVGGHGTHTLRTRVLDNAGNASIWRTDTIEIDAVSGDVTAPTDTTTLAPVEWRATPIPVTVSATDAGSGVAEVQWRLDGQPLQTHSGASASFTISGEGSHLLETRARDLATNRSSWREQYFKIDLTVPTDTTAIPSGWHNSRSITLSATDALSGIQTIQYKVDGGSTQNAASGQTVTVPADGTYTISHRAIDNAEHATAWVNSTLKADTALPVNTSAVPASTWLDEPLELALTGTDAGSGVSAMQWRVDGGTLQTGDTAVVAAEGVHTLQTRAVDAAGNVSAWRSDTVRVDATAPVNTTPAPSSGWLAAPYTVEVTGTDGGSGVDKIERTLDGGAVSEDADVTVADSGVHELRTRVIDNVGHASAWRTDTIRIDTVAPQTGLACGDGGWSAAPVACSVVADGGHSGLASLSLSRNGAGSAVAAGSAVDVGTDGVHELRLDAVDGAGNAATALATVRVDRTAPVAAVSCAKTADGAGYSCRTTASDATSGLASVAYSLDGGAWTTVAAGGEFAVRKGAVRVRSVDAAGNEAISAAVTLADLSKPESGATVKIASVPVYLAGHTNAAGLVGALSAARSANGTVSLDLRPLAVGRGKYRVEVTLKAAKRHAEVTRTYTVGRTGALPRINASLKRATASCTVTLDVRKRVGDRWRRHASSRLVLRS